MSFVLESEEAVGEGRGYVKVWKCWSVVERDVAVNKVSVGGVMYV